MSTCQIKYIHFVNQISHKMNVLSQILKIQQNIHELNEFFKEKFDIKEISKWTKILKIITFVIWICVKLFSKRLFKMKAKILIIIWKTSHLNAFGLNVVIKLMTNQNLIIISLVFLMKSYINVIIIRIAIKVINLIKVWKDTERVLIQGLNWNVFGLNVNLKLLLFIIWKDNLIHSEDKSFKCDFEDCNQVFKQKYSLDSNEKSFVCDWNQCHKKFKLKSFLRQHKNAVHLKLRKFECNYEGCHQRFNRKSYLKIDCRKHSNEKPFICNYMNCRKSFSFNIQLKVHTKRHLCIKNYSQTDRQTFLDIII
jgi:hypothetical protein